MEAMIQKNKNWIGSLQAALDRPVEGVGDLIRGWNALRESKGLTGGWEARGELIVGTFHECGCPLVRCDFLPLNPVQCLCSKGMVRAVFSRAAGGDVEVDMARSIGNGDERCEFRVILGS